METLILQDMEERLKIIGSRDAEKLSDQNFRIIATALAKRQKSAEWAKSIIFGG